MIRLYRVIIHSIYVSQQSRFLGWVTSGGNHQTYSKQTILKCFEYKNTKSKSLNNASFNYQLNKASIFVRPLLADVQILVHVIKDIKFLI